MTQQTDKREKVLDAALACFARYGFRRTAMRDIAQQAGMSRPALYLLFKNKTDIYQALVALVFERTLSAAQEALDGDGPLAARIGAALQANEGALYALIYGSPHGPELLDIHLDATDIKRAAAARARTMMAGALIRAEAEGEINLRADGPNAEQVADMILAAAHGLKSLDLDVAAYKTRLADLAQIMVSGLSVSC